MNLCRSSAIIAMVNDEKKTVTAKAALVTLQRIYDSTPKGQYFVRMSTRVIGVVKMHRVRSASASVAINVFLAVRISGKKKKKTGISPDRLKIQ